MEAFAFERFHGLSLLNDPQEIGGDHALDCLNVDIDRRGRLRTRDGFEQFTDVEGTNRYDSLEFFQPTAGAGEIVAGAGNRLEAIDATGAVTFSSAAPTASPHNMVAIGAAGAPRLYIANGTDQIRRYDGAAFTSPAGLAAQTGKVVATHETRLVHARTSTNLSRVAFSNAGDPETFSADDWVDITPGDGEEITALISWEGSLFAFKQTKFAVFGPSSTDSTGGAVFNYRLENTGVGATGGQGVCGSPEGVYFAGYDGVYLTTGGPPRKVSGPIQPLLRQDIPAGYTASSYLISHTDGTMQLTYHEGRVYIATPDFATAYRIFVLDPETGDWLVWGISASAVTTTAFGGEARTRLAFSYATGTKHIGRVDASQTTDAGTAISWLWRSGSYDLGSPNSKRLRGLELWGTGSPTVAVFADHGSSDSLAAAVTLGTSPAVARGRHLKGYRGRLFSHKLSGSGAVSVNRLTVLARDQRFQ